MTPQEKARQIRPLIVKASASLSDEDALGGVELFPVYKIGEAYKRGFRFRFGTKLIKVLQDHTSQADWVPDSTPSLYAEVEEPGQGDTPDNPIPYDNNMELFEGKYYSQDGSIYYCWRNTGVPVYNPLSTLIGIYVELYTEG